MNENIQYPEFFEELEPLLLRAGFQVTYGNFVTIRKGRFIADLWPYQMVLANALAMNHPGFNIVYHQRPDFIKQFPCSNTPDKQLVKTLRYLHRWHLE